MVIVDIAVCSVRANPLLANAPFHYKSEPVLAERSRGKGRLGSGEGKSAGHQQQGREADRHAPGGFTGASS